MEVTDHQSYDVRDWLSDMVRQCRSLGAEYADARYMAIRKEHYHVLNGRVDQITSSSDMGLGVRVLVNGYWGFASGPGPAGHPAHTTVQNALGMARAASLAAGPPVRLAPLPPQHGTYRTEVRVHPDTVPVEDKLAVLLETDEIMAGVPRVASRRSQLSFVYTDKWFANTEGSLLQQSIVECGGGILALAVGGGDAQVRAYPQLMGDQVQAGWEWILAMDLPGHARTVAEEAAALLDAPECPPGEHDVIITGSQLALQLHESCGHPIELDRVLGVETDLAGTSFLTLDGLGQRRYGSPLVTITADATIPGALGSFGWDDEGVPARRTLLVDRGLHVGYLTSRQYVVRPGDSSGGQARCSDWAKPPIVRMTNINLLPGQGTLEDLIADTRRGFLLDGQRTWSIDDRRLNFAFGVQYAREITGGKLGRLVKNAGYTGITPEVWNSCDGVAGPESWRVWGLTGCGKGSPVQNLHVGHGTSPARFRRLKVGIKR